MPANRKEPGSALFWFQSLYFRWNYRQDRPHGSFIPSGAGSVSASLLFDLLFPFIQPFQVILFQAFGFV